MFIVTIVHGAWLESAMSVLGGFRLREIKH